jgi:hypothetical protein
MYFQQKYLKYKKKYLNLKKQVGGNKFRAVVSDLLESSGGSTPKKFNFDVKVYGEFPRELKTSISDNYVAIVNFNYGNKTYDILWNIEADIDWRLEPKPGSEEDKYRDKLLDIQKNYRSENEKEIIDTATKAFNELFSSLQPEKPVAKFIPTIIEDPKINHTIIASKEFINYNDYNSYTLVDTLNKLVNLLGCKGYTLEDKDWIQKRLEQLFIYTHENYDETIKIFNKDKEYAITYYNKLNSIYNQFKTYFINNLVLNQVDRTNRSYRENMGKVILDHKEYMYKQFNSDAIEITLGLERILNCYEFIDNCNKIYFNISNSIKINGQNITVNIKFVEIPKIILFSLNNNRINYGYLMEIVNGTTIRDIILNDRTYWNENEDIIKKTIHLLIDKLSSINYLIDDMQYDNIMWNKQTNTLTYIDISYNSFNRKEASIENNNQLMNVMGNRVY